MWVRGLKLIILNKIGLKITQVAPYVGAWIETYTFLRVLIEYKVAPYVGAWIETRQRRSCHVLLRVAPYVGAWIETVGKYNDEMCFNRRTLCGCVD